MDLQFVQRTPKETLFGLKKRLAYEIVCVSKSVLTQKALAAFCINNVFSKICVFEKGRGKLSGKLCLRVAIN